MDAKKIRGHTLSRSSTGMLEAKDQRLKRKTFSKKKEKKIVKTFGGNLKKNCLKKKIFLVIYTLLTIQKIVLSSSRGQGNFRELEASRPRTSPRNPPLIYSPLVQFPKHEHSSVQTILFVVPLQYFFHPHLSRIRQAFEAAGKIVQTGDYLKSVPID